MIRAFLSLVRKAEIAGDAGRILVFQLAGLAITLVSSVLVARALGPTEKGMFDLYTLLLSLVVEFGLLGLPAGLLYAAMRRKEPMDRVHGTGLVLVLAVSGLAIVLLVGFGEQLWLLFPGMPDWVLDMVLFAVPSGLYMVVWSNLLIAQNRAVLLQRFSVLFGAINLLLVLLLFGTGHLNIRNLLLASVVLSILIALFAFAYLRRSHAAVAFDGEVAKRSMRFGLPIFLGSIANFLHFKVDQFMISAWIGLEGVGLYALSVRWAEMLFLVDAAIVTAALYRIGSKQPEESRAFATDVMLIQLGVGVVAALGLGLMVWFGFEWLYGSPYAPSVVPLILLLPGVLFWSVSKPLSNYLSYTCGRARLVGWYSAIGLMVNVILNILFIRDFGMGIAGAALASSISYVLVATLVGLTVYLQPGRVHVPD
jgi:O-antigen/teichoic acid export membrane protein